MTFCEKVHLPLPVMCHMSHVKCHMSHVTCHVSHVMCHISHVTIFFIFYFFYKVVNLVVVGSVINGATPSSFVRLIHVSKDKVLNGSGRKSVWPCLEKLRTQKYVSTGAREATRKSPRTTLKTASCLMLQNDSIWRSGWLVSRMGGGATLYML